MECDSAVDWCNWFLFVCFLLQIKIPFLFQTNWICRTNGIFRIYLFGFVRSYVAVLVLDRKTALVHFLSFLFSVSTPRTVRAVSTNDQMQLKTQTTMLTKSSPSTSTSTSLTLFTYHSRTHNFQLIDIHRAKEQQPKRKKEEEAKTNQTKKKTNKQTNNETKRNKSKAKCDIMCKCNKMYYAGASICTHT